MSASDNHGWPGAVVRSAPMTRLEQLEAFVAWERAHQPNKTHIAEWALAELQRRFLEIQRLKEDLTQAAQDVLAERRRQVRVEGWTPEHDDEHDQGELAAASAAYALAAADALHPLSQGDGGFAQSPPLSWPWAAEWWKPGEPRRMLEKATALGLAAIEQLDRAAAKGPVTSEASSLANWTGTQSASGNDAAITFPAPSGDWGVIEP